MFFCVTHSSKTKAPRRRRRAAAADFVCAGGGGGAAAILPPAARRLPRRVGCGGGAGFYSTRPAAAAPTKTAPPPRPHQHPPRAAAPPYRGLADAAPSPPTLCAPAASAARRRSCRRRRGGGRRVLGAVAGRAFPSGLLHVFACCHDARCVVVRCHWLIRTSRGDIRSRYDWPSQVVFPPRHGRQALSHASTSTTELLQYRKSLLNTSFRLSVNSFHTRESALCSGQSSRYRYGGRALGGIRRNVSRTFLCLEWASGAPIDNATLIGRVVARRYSAATERAGILARRPGRSTREPEAPENVRKPGD